MARGLRWCWFAGGLSVVLGCGEPPPPAAPTPASDVDIPRVKPTASATVAALPDPVLPPLPAPRAPCDAAAALRKDADDALAKGRAYRAARAVERADKLCPTTAAASWKTRLGALSGLGRDDAARALANEIVAAPSADPAVVAAARAELAKATAPAASTGPAASSATAPAQKPAATKASGATGKAGAGASKGAAAKAPAPPPMSAGEKLLGAALAAHGSGAADARAQMDRALVRLEQEASEGPRAFFDVGPREALAISGDGAVAAIGAGNTAILIDTKDLQPRRFFDHPERVEAAALSPDGKRLAAVSKGDVMVWSTETGKLVRTLSWAREDIGLAAFSADGKRIVTAAGNPFDALVRVWDAETGDSIESFSITGTFEPTAIAISRDNKLIAVGTKLGVVELWALGPVKKIARLADEKSFMENTTSLDFSPKGDRVVACSGSGKVQIWETKQGKPGVQVEGGERTGVSAVMFSADGSRLVASGKEGFDPVIREWDTASGKALQNKPVTVAVDLFSRDGKVGVGAGDDGVGVLDVAARTAVTARAKGVRLRSLHFGPARTLAVTPSFDKGLFLLTPRGIRSFEVDHFHGSIAVSLDGRALAHADYRTVRSWDVDTGAALPGYPEADGSLGPIAFAPEGRQVRAAAWERDEVSVLAASPGETGWKEIFQEKRKDARKLFLAAHGRFGLLAEDKRALVVDLTAGRARSLEDEGSERIQGAAISGDGTAAFLLRDRTLSRFDTRTGKRTHGPVPVDCYSNELAISFDGSQGAVACSRDVVTLSFAPGGEVKTEARLHLQDIVSDAIAIAPHGDLIATGHDRGYVRFWTRAGEQRGDVHWLEGGDAALVRVPDGRVLPLGRDVARAESRLFCRVGTKALPFVVCADALRDEGLLEEVLAPAP